MFEYPDFVTNLSTNISVKNLFMKITVHLLCTLLLLGLQASPKMRLDSSFYKNRLGFGYSLDYRPRNKLLHILTYHALLNGYKPHNRKEF